MEAVGCPQCWLLLWMRNGGLTLFRFSLLSSDAIAIMLAKIVDIACKKCPKWLSAPQCRPIVMALCAHWSRVAAPACTPEGFPQVTYLGGMCVVVSGIPHVFSVLVVPLLLCVWKAVR